MVDVGELSQYIHNYVTKACGDVITNIDVAQFQNEVIITLQHSAATDEPYHVAFGALFEYNKELQHRGEVFHASVIAQDTQQLMHEITMFRGTGTATDLNSLVDILKKMTDTKH